MPYDFLSLKRTIVTGSMYDELPETKWLFLTMLYECTAGVIVASVAHLARTAGLSVEEVERGLAALQRDDPQSTSQQSGGKRIEPVAGSRNTYVIVNFGKYNESLVTGVRSGLGPVVDPNTGERLRSTRPDGGRCRLYDRQHKRMERAAKRASDALQGQSPTDDVRNVQDVQSVHKKKGNQSKAKSEDPPTPPKGRRRRRVSEALHQGEPENDETWRQFEAIYPKPANGMPLQKADARRIWDQLAEDGQDMGMVVSGARAYSERINALKMHHRVRQMTVWLNKRGWDECYHIDPTSDEGKRLAAEKEAEFRKRRAAHEAEFKAAHEAYALSIALDGICDPAFQSEWRSEKQKDAQRKRVKGMTRAAEMIERQLTDPDETRASMIRDWREQNAAIILDFWQWDAEMNPNGFERVT